MLLVFLVEKVQIRRLTVRCPTYTGAISEQGDIALSSNVHY